jgi:hypothetical protein
MKPIPTTFGIPDTLPPLKRRDLRSCFVFGGMGLFVLLLGLFPSLRPPPRAALPLAICWLALPAWGLFRFLKGKSRADVQLREKRGSGTSTQAGLYMLVMVGVGVGYFLWARRLCVASSVIFGTLLLIEGLGGVIVSMTEWWRLSHIGLAFGLMAGGFFLPLDGKLSMAVPVGGAFLMGSLLSAGILYWQVRNHEATLALSSSLGNAD